MVSPPSRPAGGMGGEAFRGASAPGWCIVAGMTRPLTCTAALLILALPAWAGPAQDKPPPIGLHRRVHVVEGPAEKPPPLERHPADIPGPACSAEHHQPILDQALAEARRRIAEAVRLMREEPEHAHVRRWFGDAGRKTVRMTLELTATRLESLDGVEMRCNDTSACPDGRFAYAREMDMILGVCPPFFRARMDGTDSRWGILIHEATHLAANTRDHAYRPNGALALAKQDGLRAAENADNYEYFVETLPR